MEIRQDPRSILGHAEGLCLPGCSVQLPVDQVDTALVLRAVEPIWLTKQPDRQPGAGPDRGGAEWL